MFNNSQNNPVFSASGTNPSKTTKQKVGEEFCSSSESF